MSPTSPSRAPPPAVCCLVRLAGCCARSLVASPLGLGWGCPLKRRRRMRAKRLKRGRSRGPSVSSSGLWWCPVRWPPIFGRNEAEAESGDALPFVFVLERRALRDVREGHAGRVSVADQALGTGDTGEKVCITASRSSATGDTLGALPPNADARKTGRPEEGFRTPLRPMEGEDGGHPAPAVGEELAAAMDLDKVGQKRIDVGATICMGSVVIHASACMNPRGLRLGMPVRRPQCRPHAC